LGKPRTNKASHSRSSTSRIQLLLKVSSCLAHAGLNIQRSNRPSIQGESRNDQRNAWLILHTQSRRSACVYPREAGLCAHRHGRGLANLRHTRGRLGCSSIREGVPFDLFLLRRHSQDSRGLEIAWRRIFLGDH